MQHANHRGINDLSSSSSSSSGPASFFYPQRSTTGTITGPTTGPPHHPHPIRTALDDFVGSTPLVTRYLVGVLWTTHLLSWFFPYSSSLALANYPEFTIGKGEVYRVITSLLVNPGFVDSFLFHLAVIQPTKVLETSLGSVRLFYFIVTLSISTNLLFLASWSILSARLLEVPPNWLLAQSTSSLWLAGFGLLALEAVRADNSTGHDGDDDDGDGDDGGGSHYSAKHRRVCFLKVRTRYSPLALYALLTLLSMRVDAGYFLSLVLGFAVAHQWLSGAADRCLLSYLSISRIQAWEEDNNSGAWLSRLVSSSNSSWTRGYVSARSATGIQAFRNTSAAGLQGNGLVRAHPRNSKGAEPYLDFALKAFLLAQSIHLCPFSSSHPLSLLPLP
jgi:hypothetical protein